MSETPDQVTHDEFERMSPTEINAARRAGRLHDVMSTPAPRKPLELSESAWALAARHGLLEHERAERVRARDVEARAKNLAQLDPVTRQDLEGLI
jgi:hypothetical protein